MKTKIWPILMISFLSFTKNGIVLKNIPETSVYYKLGLSSQDKIVSVNGKNVKKENEFASEIKKVKSIKVDRAGKEVILNYK